MDPPSGPFSTAASPSPRVPEQDALPAGVPGRPTNSARAGYIPLSLSRVPIEALKGISIYLRLAPPTDQPAGEHASEPGFQLYCADHVRFTEAHRVRLVEHGVRFIYIRIADQARFRLQTQHHLEQAAADPALAATERAALVYETSVELMNELLAEPELLGRSPALEQISRSVSTLVINDPSAFTHLFAISHHDFYTATHMVNVATWMVPLAYELGHRDPEELSRICQAGILHDMGKIAIPDAVLNKPGPLTDDEWAMIRGHPEAGAEYLSQFDNLHPLVLTVARQHHERMDGSGYPDRLKGDQIHPISRICAVVDSFDAMTAFRPFKQQTLSVAQAMKILREETPVKYDPLVMEGWSRLVRPLEQSSGDPQSPDPAPAPAVNRRRYPRKKFHCPGHAHTLAAAGQAQTDHAAVAIIAHSISRSGLGFFSRTPIAPGQSLRVFLHARGWDNRPLGGEIVRCREYPDGWYEMGMRFTALEEPGAVDNITEIPPRSAAA